MDWLSPVSGLVGALVGAAATYVGAHQAQARALAEARQARLEAKQDTAVATLADTFGKLQRHIRDVPGARERGLDAEASAEFTAARQTWDQKLEDLTGPARIAVGVIRDEAVRARLRETLDVLDAWQSGLEYAYRGGARSRAWVLRGVLFPRGGVRRGVAAGGAATGAELRLQRSRGVPGVEARGGRAHRPGRGRVPPGAARPSPGRGLVAG
ncbi:hypothetical protein OG729_01590 [Streptomyces sp. NBC_00210]|uniref:hypothetical protein n=1 Tax=Streptomyces sp. NBC_00210 TaxID=2903636 RepID=UPI0032469595